ncbi:MAG: NADH-quinone oxidoreductase subunit [Pseudomonadota bacterium]|nr:NADH-quinone oxidoreductase subunit [Pseudomonadota bacterium]
MELELDGKKVNAESGSTILEVALREGKYIPHFCYHKKLSIAANCRMCLVEVEKAPKPLPACATPITEGMKIHTASKMAVEAQKGVMEFLLINHPLDCPICDQGGECQLQDLSVGYGRSSSRFEEEKRAVTNKDLGPLVSTAMTRCIHCSRCVRFTDEIAGFQELGMSYRNNHVEVMPFIGKTVNSELSGNIIDICPVGALLSKPFKNQYRNWELARRKTIAPHDGLGSNVIAQIDKYHKVVRVLPLENEEINECWLSDRDRFSYEGLYHEERAKVPMIKQDGKWHNVDWETALGYAARGISGVINDYGSDTVGVLASASSTTEELYLLQKLMRGLNVANIDSRLGQADFALDDMLCASGGSGSVDGVAATTNSAFYLGSSIDDLVGSGAILLVGSVIRQEQPLLAHRIRQAVKHGCELNVINVMREDLLCKTKNQLTCDPRELVYFLAQVVKATAKMGNEAQLGQHQLVDQLVDLNEVEITPEAVAIADSLMKHNGYIVLGEVAKSLPDYSQVVILAQQLAQNIQGKFGILSGKANEVGAQLLGCVPYKGAFGHAVSNKGLNVTQMLVKPRKAYVLLNTELEQDVYNSALALNALKAAQTVIVMSAFVNDKMQEYADVILPISPYAETAGSYINMLGKWQTFNGVAKPLQEAKPGWKVLRVLANHLQTEGFDYNSIEDVRNEIKLGLDLTKLCNTKVCNTNVCNTNACDTNVCSAGDMSKDSGKVGDLKIMKPVLDGLVRFGIQGPYAGDSITRRAYSLQNTDHAKLPILSISPKLADKLGVVKGQEITLRQGDALGANAASGKFNLAICDRLPENVVLFTANKLSSDFAGRYDSIEVIS